MAPEVKAGPIRDTKRSTVFSVRLMGYAGAMASASVVFVIRVRPGVGVAVSWAVGDTGAPVEAHVGVFVELSFGEGLGLGMLVSCPAFIEDGGMLGSVPG